MNRSVRAFVAVETSPEVRARAIELMRRLASPGDSASRSPTLKDTLKDNIKWVEAHNLHMTLNFLGNVELVEVPQVCDAVARAVAAFAPFDFEVLGAGAFPDGRRPRTVWLGVGSGTLELRQLHSAVGDELAPLGFRRETRQFTPHLTIGRIKGEARAGEAIGQLIAEHADYAVGLTSVEEVVVFSSELGRQGPLYEPLSTAPLGGS